MGVVVADRMAFACVEAQQQLCVKSKVFMWKNVAFFMDFFFEASEFSSSSSFFRLWPKNTGRSAGLTCLVAVNMLKDAT